MFRKFFLCIILSLLLVGALSAEAGYPVLLSLSALMLLAVCRKIRDAGDGAPVIFLTVSDLELGFSLGASDDVSKPFDSREVLARVKAVCPARRRNLITLCAWTPCAAWSASRANRAGWQWT